MNSMKPENYNESLTSFLLLLSQMNIFANNFSNCCQEIVIPACFLRESLAESEEIPA